MKPVKQYYIYVHDEVLGGPCYLKISSYLPFQSEFYFNGHNAIKLNLDREGVSYKMKENSFINVYARHGRDFIGCKSPVCKPCSCRETGT